MVDEIQHDFGFRVVQTAADLVQQDQVGRGCQGTGHFEPFLITERKFLSHAVRLLVQAHQLEILHGVGSGVCASIYRPPAVVRR